MPMETRNRATRGDTTPEIESTEAPMASTEPPQKETPHPQGEKMTEIFTEAEEADLVRLRAELVCEKREEARRLREGIAILRAERARAETERSAPGEREQSSRGWYNSDGEPWGHESTME